MNVNNYEKITQEDYFGFADEDILNKKHLSDIRRFVYENGMC
jgi:hypothetical protein